MEISKRSQTRKSLIGWFHRKDNIPTVVARGIDQTEMQEKAKLRFKTAVLFTATFVGIFALFTTLGAVTQVAGVSGSSSPSGPLVSNCTVTTVSGTFWTKTTSDVWQEGSDGMVLEAGNLIKTDAQSKVVLTFFEGSTITLESNAEIKIEQLSKITAGYYTILIQQILGRTWSLVSKITDIRSRYEIHTPSAAAMVRGTSFIVDVDSAGSTHVGVSEGVVAVEAQGNEVSVPAGYESTVSSGTDPSAPSQMDPGVMQSYPGHSNSLDNNNSGGQGNGNSNGLDNNNSGDKVKDDKVKDDKAVAPVKDDKVKDDKAVAPAKDDKVKDDKAVAPAKDDKVKDDKVKDDKAVAPAKDDKVNK